MFVLAVAFAVAGHQVVLVRNVGDETACTRKCLTNGLAGFVEFVRGGFEAFDGSQIPPRGGAGYVAGPVFVLNAVFPIGKTGFWRKSWDLT